MHGNYALGFWKGRYLCIGAPYRQSRGEYLLSDPPVRLYFSSYRFFLQFSNVRWFLLGYFLSVTFQIVRRNLFLFTFIVLILFSGKFIRSEWTHMRSTVNELPALLTAQADVSNHQVALSQEMSRRVERLSEATVQRLDVKIHGLDNEITRLQRERKNASLSSGALKGADWIVEELRQETIRRVEIELRHQARAYLSTLRAHAVVLSNRRAALEQLEKLRLAHARIYEGLQSTEQQLTKIQADLGVLVKIPFTKWYEQVEKLKKDVKAGKAANSRVHKDYLAQKAILARLSLPVTLKQFKVNDQQLAEAVSTLRDRVLESERLAAQNHLWQAYQAVRPVLPIALAMLIGWWLVPVAVRTLFYFVLAPHAARRPPIVIGTKQGSTTLTFSDQRSARESSVISAVSQTMTLAPDHEMLIRPDYSQSQPTGVNTTTKLLFDWNHWLTSIAAHLWVLKRLRTTQRADIVVSSTTDALDEVALLEIAPGEAVVLQPRGLVGMMYKTGQRPKIRSHWRLGTLHAWLTFQLRYLAFEGPATLIVKGCRGVRLESASTGRTISQDATLGFSANAVYATVRADPFIPYLRGRQSLFHDKFTGQDAYYLYEEVPRNARPDGQKHNPLEVLLDASLKAFGI
jgi:hypothetical protein